MIINLVIFSWHSTRKDLDRSVKMYIPWGATNLNTRMNAEALSIPTPQGVSNWIKIKGPSLPELWTGKQPFPQWLMKSTSNVATIVMLMLFVVALVMVLSMWRLKRVAIDPVPKRKSQYGFRLQGSNL
jgi:hypothetical protein